MRLEQKPEPTRTRTEMDFRLDLLPLPPAQPSCLLPLSLPLLCVGKPPSCIRGVPSGAEPVSIPADHPQMTSGLREVSGGIPLALETGETTEVSVSGGEFSLFDPEGELLGDGTEAEISETFCSTGTSPAQRTPCFP